VAIRLTKLIPHKPGVNINKVISEFVGTLVLVATVVGSGIMATNLSEDIGIQLLINTVATVSVLIVLISIFQSISGAHFNPAVTLIEVIQRRVEPKQASIFVIAQFLGGIAGVALAHTMFDLETFSQSETVRTGSNIFISEVVATAGLIFVINILVTQKRTVLIPALVGLWIGAGYLFTASTSFANPAVTLARSFTNSFSGISPDSVLMFILAQLIGALIGLLLVKLLMNRSENVSN
jgi:glycerol uptake facilitator-like aquaporin